MSNITETALQNEERIMAFLRGEMTPKEESNFIAEMDNDQRLKADAINLARIAKGLRQVGEENNKLLISAFKHSDKGLLHKEEIDKAEFLEIANYQLKECAQRKCKSYSDEDTTERYYEAKNSSSHKIPVYLSIAASLIIFAWLGTEYYSYKSTTGMGNDYCNAISSGIIARGEADNVGMEKKLYALFENVQNTNDLDSAIRNLAIYWKRSNEEQYNEYTNYSAEIGWYLAIAYLKENDKKNAKIVLEKLIATTEKDSAINKKARELLNQL